MALQKINNEPMTSEKIEIEKVYFIKPVFNETTFTRDVARGTEISLQGNFIYVKNPVAEAYSPIANVSFFILAKK